MADRPAPLRPAVSSLADTEQRPSVAAVVRAEPSSPRESSQRTRWPVLALTLFAIFALYALIASAGLSGPWPIYTVYYDLLAEGFRAGHLYVPVDPHPMLLAQANPYDPIHRPYWLWDVSLYGGRYYMYWGPVPALLQALLKSALRIDGLIGDQYLVFAMHCASASAAALLIERMQRRLFPELTTWQVALATTTFACANPTLYLLATGGVYQASIAAAQAFLLVGLVFAFDAVWQGQTRPARAHHLVLAGTAFACAVGSRVSTALVVVALVLLTALAAAFPRDLRSWRSFFPAVRALSLMGLPIAVVVASLLVYNKLRFDSFSEFGTNFMLTTLKFRVSADYWRVNLWSYLLRPFRSDCHFPFVLAPWKPTPEEALSVGANIPDGYLLTEPLVGWLRVVITTWFIPIALVAGYRSLRRIQLSRGLVVAEPSRAASYAFCVAAFGLLSTLTGIILLGMYMTTMRYLGDVTSGLSLLGLVGAFTVCGNARGRTSRVIARVATTSAMLATIVFGLLLGYQGYELHFKKFNPSLDAQLVDTLSLCE